MSDKDQETQQAEADAREAIQADEIALRVRALGVAIVTAISAGDKKDEREEARDASDPLFLIMEASLDMVDLAMREQRKTRESLESIAKSLNKMSNPVWVDGETGINLSEQG